MQYEGWDFAWTRTGALPVLDNKAEHERELREAHRLFTEIGATGHAERVGRELGLSSSGSLDPAHPG